MESGQYDRALLIATTIDSSASRDGALVEIAVTYAGIGQYEHALFAAETVNDPREMARALTEIAASYAETGQEVDGRAKNILRRITQRFEVTS